MALEGELDLPEGEEFEATLYLPAGFELKSARGKARLAGQKGRIARLAAVSGAWRCSFSRR
jgi:hypothetical protein